MPRPSAIPCPGPPAPPFRFTGRPRGDGTNSVAVSTLHLPIVALHLGGILPHMPTPYHSHGSGRHHWLHPPFPCPLPRPRSIPCALLLRPLPNMSISHDCSRSLGDLRTLNPPHLFPLRSHVRATRSVGPHSHSTSCLRASFVYTPVCAKGKTNALYFDIGLLPLHSLHLPTVLPYSLPSHFGSILLPIP